MCVSHKCKSPLQQKPRHGAQGGALRHPPLCSVFTIFLLTLFIFIPSVKTLAAPLENPVEFPLNGSYVSGYYRYSITVSDYNFTDNVVDRIIIITTDNTTTYTRDKGDIYMSHFYVSVGSSVRDFKLSQNEGYYDSNINFYPCSINTDGSIRISTAYTYNIFSNISGIKLGLNCTMASNSDLSPYVPAPTSTPTPTPTPSPTPVPEYYNGFGDQDIPHGLKGWLKDLWSFLTDPEDYGTIQVGDGDTLIYSTPTPQPTPTPYIQQQQVINPNTGEVVYNIETNIENSNSQVYPTDYVWLDDVPDTVPHEFDLNFSVSGTPTEYTTDLNFSETSDAFIDTVSGVSDGVNALGSLLGAMPIEIIIYPIVAFCIWAIFAFIHRLLG